jgi:hypothetical protein
MSSMSSWQAWARGCRIRWCFLAGLITLEIFADFARTAGRRGREGAASCRFRANSAHVRQSRPYSGLCFRVKVLKKIELGTCQTVKARFWPWLSCEKPLWPWPGLGFQLKDLYGLGTRKTVPARFWPLLSGESPQKPDLGTFKTVEARFWPWLSGESRYKTFSVVPSSLDRG